MSTKRKISKKSVLTKSNIVNSVQATDIMDIRGKNIKFYDYESLMEMTRQKVEISYPNNWMLGIVGQLMKLVARKKSSSEFSKNENNILLRLGIADLSTQLLLVSLLKKYGFSVLSFFSLVVVLIAIEDESFLQLIKEREFFVKEMVNKDISGKKQKDVFEYVIKKVKEKKENFFNFCYNYK